ncbi:Thioesterase-like superfamily protein [Geodermatophilus saharensis]|uniref:Thioesterase-like superfamily protein n=1 Tax=Geodermatophilus saharensis TaxID=1137994 RepID=A0A239B9G1_9ACTN|nr:thioesterase family protein [Geodermatophilus saharensis]SNS03743.1 Thioesterase-like superfamily protein [Geodermatophilus saharensis]
MQLPPAYYLPDGPGAFVATALTIGPWDPGLQHAGPPAALLAREVERTGGIDGGQPVRLAFDVLGPVPVGPVRVAARVLRPGRRIELVEATLEAGGRPVVRLTAWRMRVRDSAATAHPPQRLAVGPEDGRPAQFDVFSEEVAYHRSLEWREAGGSITATGPAAAWTRPLCGLVEGEPITPLEHLLVMTDAASGISAALDWSQATFANVDLVVALFRQPAGEWLAMDAVTTLGPGGLGQCAADLYDADGRIGRSVASLFVEPR